ncbi:MAG: slipin family protein [Anaerolineae bacterium]|nr:slipin family protein [Anaerolineae bacterium]
MARTPQKQKEIIIRDTHRALWYEDGKLLKVLEGGRYELPQQTLLMRLLNQRIPKIDVVLVDIRQRDLTIKGQEILTSDKVAIRVSIIVQFRVTDPKAAVQEVENYEDRLYSDVQLAARRSLASMNLEQILTNRNQLSEDILSDVKGSAGAYGVQILRADVKDIIFPGNLQEVMNKVLTAERLSQAQLVDARTKAEVQKLESQTRSEIRRSEAQVQAETARQAALSEAEAARIKTETELNALGERAKAAQAFTQHPVLIRLTELETLRQIAQSPNAKLYVNFDRDKQSDQDEKGESAPF